MPIKCSEVPKDVRYEIRTRETMRLAMIGNPGQMVDDDTEFIPMATLRRCSNVPGQWAVPTARGGFQSIKQLVTPGSSFNTPYADHFRITTLPDTDTVNVVFDRFGACLAQYG